MTTEPGRHLLIEDRGRSLHGVVRSGESWAAAARRTVASLSVEPVPVDLSGEDLTFLVDHDTRVALRAMVRGDLPDVVRWRQQPHVERWWSNDGPATTESVTKLYGPSIDGMSPTRMWVAEVNGRSIGFVQDYRLRDYPEYALLCPDPDAVALDYAIGEPEWIGRGYGARIVWAWLQKVRHRFPDVSAVFAAPDHRNTASIRMLEKVGFRQGIWFDEPNKQGSVDTVIGCTLDIPVVVG